MYKHALKLKDNKFVKEAESIFNFLQTINIPKELIGGIYFAIGEIKITCRNKREANNHFKKAYDILTHLKRHMLSIPDRYRIASQYKKFGWLKESNVIFKGILSNRLNKEIRGKIYYHLGDICINQRRTKKAKFFMKKAVKYFPGHNKANKALQMVL